MKDLPAPVSRSDSLLQQLTGKASLRTHGWVYVLIDTSESMGDRGKLQHAVAGAIAFAMEAQTQGWEVGAIQFASEARHVMAPSREVSGFAAALQGLSAAGSTDMRAGLQLVTERLVPFSGRRVAYVITDGIPDDRKAALETAAYATSFGIDIMVLGTEDADQEFLRLLATKAHLVRTVGERQLRAGIAEMAKLLPGKVR